MTTRRSFLKTAALGAAAALTWSVRAHAADKPNVIVIFCDDMGYGDLGCFGHPTIRTPNLDRLASEGQKWTSFYAAASVCTPSRAGLLTGRLPIRSGMCSSKRRVLFPDSAGGLPRSEISLARALKNVGYNTACVGKWHLGHLPEYLPTLHGFDSYFGIPYSNDMDKVRRLSKEEQMDPKTDLYNVPLMRDKEIIEQPADQNTITKRYNEEAVKFIKDNKDEPFFLYLAHSMVHIPLFASDDFRGKSARGLYGDTVMEIDAGVGEIVNTLKEEGIAENTLVVFTSDNGPWLIFDQHGGSAGLLRDGKGTTWEGGVREPTIFWMPGKIQPDVVHDMGSTLDIFATACAMSGAEMPDDRVMDSYDLLATLFETKPSPRKEMFFYRGSELYAARVDEYKAHYITEDVYVRETNRRTHDPVLLFNVEHDPSEKYDIAGDHPEAVEKIAAAVKAHQAGLVPGEDQLVKRIE